jgi:hypothetical protein
MSVAAPLGRCLAGQCERLARASKCGHWMPLELAQSNARRRADPLLSCRGGSLACVVALSIAQQCRSRPGHDPARDRARPQVVSTGAGQAAQDVGGLLTARKALAGFWSSVGARAWRRALCRVANRRSVVFDRGPMIRRVERSIVFVI